MTNVRSLSPILNFKRKITFCFDSLEIMTAGKTPVWKKDYLEGQNLAISWQY